MLLLTSERVPVQLILFMSTKTSYEATQTNVVWVLLAQRWAMILDMNTTVCRVDTYLINPQLSVCFFTKSSSTKYFTQELALMCKFRRRVEFILE